MNLKEKLKNLKVGQKLKKSYDTIIIAVIVMIIVGLKAIKWLKKWIRTSPRLDKIDSSLRSFAVSFLSVVGYALLFVTALMILGVPATSFVAVLTTCAAAIGLALQGSLSNFAGGIMILLLRPFRIGDYVQTQGFEGTVKEIKLFNTVLNTENNISFILLRQIRTGHDLIGERHTFPVT